jgi:hypothetical protein
MKHTYLFEEGLWLASGNYYDENQRCIEITGETRIQHREESWILDGHMELKLDRPITFSNRYTIEPVREGQDYTTWSSVNPALGTILGSFMIVGDTILSSYKSKNGQYSGTESLVFASTAIYRNRGFAFHKNNKLSSWEVDLIRKEGR